MTMLKKKAWWLMNIPFYLIPFLYKEKRNFLFGYSQEDT